MKISASIILLSAFIISAVLYETKAQIKNIRVDNPSANDAEEVSISINPKDPQFIAAGANIRYFFSSSDMGNTWRQSTMFSRYGVWGDPCLLYDGEGNLYFTHLSYPPDSIGYWIDRIVVQKSTDNGYSWTPGAGIGFVRPKQQDKPWMGADLSSAKFKGNLYLAWTEFDSYGSKDPADSTRILFSVSSDQGETWSEPVRVSDKGGNALDGDSTVEGAVPCVGPEGQVYLAWAGPEGIMFDKSLDGGKSFGKDIFVASQPGGWDFNISGISRCNGLPVTACDTSHSAFRGNIYVLWSDQRNGETNTDVFISRSTDEGITWSSPLKVNNDNSGRQQFLPWMTIDQATGFIYVDFYDRRNTTGNATDVYMARSTDGGNSFENFKISDSSFTPSKYQFFGDYINVAAYNRNVYPIWMRLDSIKLSVWTAPFYDSTGVTGVPVYGAAPSHYNLKQNYPNPFNPSTVIDYFLPAAVRVELNVYDILGSKVSVLVDQVQAAGKHRVVFDAENTDHRTKLSGGIYFYRLRAGDFIETKKMILLK